MGRPGIARSEAAMAHGRFQGVAGVTGEVSAAGGTRGIGGRMRISPSERKRGGSPGTLPQGVGFVESGGASGWVMFGIGLHNGFVW